MVDNLGFRLASHHTYEEQAKTRGARFQVNPRNSYKWKDQRYYFNFLDRLMGEIPGKDNYPVNLTDDAFDQRAYNMDPRKKDKVLNAGYYHRWYKVMEKGAMGVQNRHRGFSDPNLFMAMTTQEKIAGKPGVVDYFSLFECAHTVIRELQIRDGYEILVRLLDNIFPLTAKN